jgi:release factor glutamine methyltransferase
MNKAREPATIGTLLQEATHLIHSDSARLDAEVLLASVLNRPRSHLLAWPERVPDPEQQQHYRELVARRAAGEPVAHLIGQREFWSLPVSVTPATLIPRPETETLVACALAILPSAARRQIADLGTGSGAIALALAHERPRCTILATDQSDAAVEVAKANALRLGLNNIEFVIGDWCKALAGRRFDLIVSNPPYIPAADRHLEQGDVRFEPHTALVAGPHGLDALTCIIACAREHLHDHAWLMLEHGFDQADPVQALLQQQGYHSIVRHRDMTGHERVTTARM